MFTSKKKKVYVAVLTHWYSKWGKIRNTNKNYLIKNPTKK